MQQQMRRVRFDMLYFFVKNYLVLENSLKRKKIRGKKKTSTFTVSQKKKNVTAHNQSK